MTQQRTSIMYDFLRTHVYKIILIVLISAFLLQFSQVIEPEPPIGQAVVVYRDSLGSHRVEGDLQRNDSIIQVHVK